MSGTILSGPIPSFTKTVTGYRAVNIRPGDRLEDIAARELGDARQWYDLAALNHLAPPWITDNPALRVPGSVLLSAQDTLLVPSTSPPATGVAAAPDVFGIDCLLVRGQLQANSNGDIQTVSGPANLDQAIGMRLNTHQGELVYYRNYGNRAYLLLGKGNTQSVAQLAASWVSAACLADPRISSIQSMTATTFGDVLACNGIIVAVNGKRLPVAMPSGAT